MQYDITQLFFSLLLGIPAIILILTKFHKTAIFCILASLLVGLDALLDISIRDGYAEEGMYATLALISKELKSGNQDLVIKALDETEMNSNNNNKYDLFERIRAAKDHSTKESFDEETSIEGPTN